ncbi:sel1 repeat family protein [Thalassovita mediterranea]|nr:sel1 repeat family protein [Thalassovita mediterranea]
MMRIRILVAAFISALVCLLAAAQSDVASQIEEAQQLANEGKYQEARAILEPLAREGQAAAQYAMGIVYANGFGVPESKSTALDWFKQAASQDHGRALYHVGLYYDRGIGVAPNSFLALENYKRGGEAGDGEAAYNAGQILLTRENRSAEDEALGTRYILLSAREETPRALIAAGWVSENGIGVDRNLTAALGYYQRADRAEHAMAEYFLHDLLDLMSAEAKTYLQAGNPEDAMRLYDAMCEGTVFEGCYQAGYHRLRGNSGVQRNRTRALRDLRLPCKHLYKNACAYLSEAVLFSNGPYEQSDITVTRERLEDACNTGDQSQCYNLAYMKADYRFRMYDLDGAMALLKTACWDENYSKACGPYAELFNRRYPAQAPSGGSSSSGGNFWSALAGAISGYSSAVSGASYQSSYGSYSSGGQSYGQQARSNAYARNLQFNEMTRRIEQYGSTAGCSQGNQYC